MRLLDDLKDEEAGRTLENSLWRGHKTLRRVKGKGGRQATHTEMQNVTPRRDLCSCVSIGTQSQ